MKLYRVNLKGLNSLSGINYSSSYVVAENSDEAYKKVRKYLDANDYGFPHQREMESVELLADSMEYNDVRTRLFY